LENIKKTVKEFKKKYQQNIENVRKQEQEKEMFKREEFPGRFTAKKLFVMT